MGRAFLCVSIDYDFSMLIREDFPKLGDNIWKIDRGLSMTNRCTKFSRLLFAQELKLVKEKVPIKSISGFGT